MKQSRHKCSKCGRKRLRNYLIKNNSINGFYGQWNKDWYNYPRIDSYLCKENCTAYSQDVQVSEAEQKSHSSFII